MIIGEYQMMERIGGGGSSKVYRGFHMESSKEVCIKEMDISLRDFWTEAYLLRKLDHPSIPKAIDLIGRRDRVYLIMSMLQGESPLKCKLDVQSLNQIMFDMAEVLDFLHNQKPSIFHGDFKPSNMLIGSRNYLLDFGLSKEEGSKFFSNIYSCGTPKYRDPSIKKGNLKFDRKSDIYSWGVTYGELLSRNGISPSKRLSNLLDRATSLDRKIRFSNFKQIISEGRRLF